MIPSDAAPPDIAWFQREVADLRREIRELRAERRGESTSIGRGGITVKDDGSIVVLSADSTKKLVIAGSVIKMYPDVVAQPNKYFLWESEAFGNMTTLGGFDEDDFGLVGGLLRLSSNAVELNLIPSGLTTAGQQTLHMSLAGGIQAVGSVGNNLATNGAWLLDRVTGLSAGNTTVNYPVTYETLPYPFVQVVAPAAVAWAVTAYSTSGFTVNVAAGPAAGTVSVLYWVVRPNVVTP